MANIRPFPSGRPPKELASRVASVPYDVVDTAEARAELEGTHVEDERQADEDQAMRAVE